MAIILPTRWTSQPSYNVPIDRSHPLSKGLVAFVYPGNTKQGGLRANINGRRVFYCDGSGTNSRILIPVPPVRMNGATIAVYGRYDDDFTAAAAVAALAGPSDSSSNSSFGLMASVYNASELFGIDSSVFGTDRISSYSNPQTPGFTAARKFNGTNTASVFANNTSYSVSLSAPGTAEFVFNTLKLFVKGTNNVDVPNAGSWTEFVAVWNRSLSDAELAAFSANPWQVLQPLQQRHYFAEAAGSGIYNVTTQETSLISEISASLSTFPISVIETSSAVDLQSASLTIDGIVSESLSADSTQNSTRLTSSSQVETTSVTHAQNSVLSAISSIAESASVSSTQSSLLSALVSQVETMSITQIQSVEDGSISVSLSESNPVADSTSSLMVSVNSTSEPLSINAIQSSLMTLNANGLEAAAASESSSSGLVSTIDASVGELLSITETSISNVFKKLVERITSAGNLIKRAIGSNLTERE